MAQPPVPGRDAGAEPGREPGLPGGGPGTPGTPDGGAGASGGNGSSLGSSDGGVGASAGSGSSLGSSGGGAGGPAGRRSPGDLRGPSVADAGRVSRLAAFASGRAGDRFPPNGWLAMMIDELSGPDRRCPGAGDDALIGLLGRWQALESWAAAGKLGVAAELARRRARPGHENRRACGLPSAWEEGTGHEVSGALAMSLPSADDFLALAVTLQARLPRTWALLTGGTITYLTAKIIAVELEVLADGLAAQAEALIADQLAGKTPGQVRRLAAAAVVSVDPKGAEKRREFAERETARVRFWREAAGTAALAAYGLPTDAALAANANIAARAKQYKKAKLDGSMDQLRVLAYLDMLNGVAAGDRIAQARAAAARAGTQAAQARDGAQAGGGSRAGQAGGGPGGPGYPDGGGSAGGTVPGGPVPGDSEPGEDDSEAGEDGPGYQWLGDDEPWDDEDLDADGTGDGEPDDYPGDDPGDDPGDGGSGRDGGPGAGPQPADLGPELAANTNLTLPLATLQQLADRPGHGHGLGPVDPALARDLAAAAARSPHSTWCLTITSPEGYAIGHGCARPSRPRRGMAPAAGSRAGPWTMTRNDHDPGPPGGWGTWILTLPSGRDLTVKLGPIPVTSCDHRYESRGYQPSDTLRHLVQVRDGVCTFPPCSRHARDCDFEHAVPYDQGGRTCGCNAGSRSRRCHRVKQSRGWAVTQPLPGWHQWRTPSGRIYTQGPMQYPA